MSSVGLRWYHKDDTKKLQFRNIPDWPFEPGKWHDVSDYVEPGHRNVTTGMRRSVGDTDNDR